VRTCNKRAAIFRLELVRAPIGFNTDTTDAVISMRKGHHHTIGVKAPPSRANQTPPAPAAEASQKKIISTHLGTISRTCVACAAREWMRTRGQGGLI